MCKIQAELWFVLIDTESVRRQISRRGIKVYLGLAHHLRTLADPDTGLINKYDLERSLVEYSIKVSQDVRYFYVCVALMNEAETCKCSCCVLYFYSNLMTCGSWLTMRTWAVWSTTSLLLPTWARWMRIGSRLCWRFVVRTLFLRLLILLTASAFVRLFRATLLVNGSYILVGFHFRLFEKWTRVRRAL